MLEASLPGTVRRQRRTAARRSGPAYVWSIVGVSVALLGLAGILMAQAGTNAAFLIAALVLGVPLALLVGGTVVHLVLRAVLPPSALLPQIPLGDPGPLVGSTCVVYPAIVSDSADIDELVETMREVARDSGPGFAGQVALVDFSDAADATLATDATLRAELLRKLAAASGAAPLSALFRTRRWNEADRVFMGWERKRGKLVEFADLVADPAADTSFTVTGPAERALVAALSDVRYVITIDVGNRLPNGGARRLVAAMAHPDNRAEIDPGTGRVTSGFGYIRPCHVPSPPRSLFEWSWQPYTAPSGQASFGQLLFGEDFFLGQGIFDVGAVRSALAGRIPDNTVLSHDKLEGMYARAACIAGAVVVEGNVEDYLAYRKRCHRWIRGDVHLLPWIGRRSGSGRRGLPLLARWMLTNDLLAHLQPVAMVALLALAWLAAPPGLVGVYTGVVVGLLLQPLLVVPVMVLLGRSSRPPRMSWRAWLAITLRLRGSMAWWLLRVEALRAPIWAVLLADRAMVALDATLRAVYRTFVSQRLVLQWTSSTRAVRTVGQGASVRWRTMALSSAFSAALAVGVALVNPPALGWSLPLLVCWFVAPQFAYWASRPDRRIPFRSR
jgi:cyclic beta-1,2-glucan synthetase